MAAPTASASWATPPRVAREGLEPLTCTGAMEFELSFSVSLRSLRALDSSRSGEDVAEDFLARGHVGHLDAVGLLAGELHRLLELLHLLEQLVDPLGRQRTGELHRPPVADGHVL